MRNLPAVLAACITLAGSVAFAEEPSAGLVHSPLEPDFALKLHSDPRVAPAPAVMRPHLALDCTRCNVVGLTGTAVFLGGYLATVAEYGAALVSASHDPGQALFISPTAVVAVGGAPMVVPVVGPLVTLGAYCADGCTADAEGRRVRNVLIADASVQAAGLALAFASQWMASTHASWTVVPAAPGGSGMTLVGKF